MAKFLSQLKRQLLPSIGTQEVSFGTPHCPRLSHGQKYTKSMLIIWLSVIAALTLKLGASYGPVTIFLPILSQTFFLLMHIAQKKKCSILRSTLMFKLGT